MADDEFGVRLCAAFLGTGDLNDDVVNLEGMTDDDRAAARRMAKIARAIRDAELIEMLDGGADGITEKVVQDLESHGELLESIYRSLLPRIARACSEIKSIADEYKELRELHYS